jgi:cysteine desulfurase family protein
MALNIALMGMLEPGDHVITSTMEHNSIARPLRYLESQGVQLTRISCDSQTGELNPSDVKAAMKPNTKLVALVHGSNVTGTILPIEEVGKITQQRGILLLVDAAQTAGTYPIDVEEMGIDSLAFTGHKSLFGPMGTGGLYVRPGLQVKPLIRGGTGSRSEEDTQPDFMPDRLESGTPNTIGLAGLGAGVKFILNEGIDKVKEDKKILTKRLLEGFAEIDGLKICGLRNTDNRLAIVSFNLENVPCSEVGQILDERYGIMVRCGLHCAPWAHKTIGTHPGGTVRASIGYFNTEKEVDFLIKAVKEISAGNA